MPELPEVETVKRTLKPLVTDRKIIAVDIYYSGIIKTPAPEQFQKILSGLTITGLERRGKYLLLALSHEYTLVIHLRMTGRLIFCSPETQLARHTHLVFHLSGGWELRFTDTRKFGLIFLVPTGKWTLAGGLADLGPEPLGEEFTALCLKEKLAPRKGGLKAFLLDQTQIAGIGNIYADEILFEAGLHPCRKPAELSHEESERLHRAVRSKLAEGIEARGTSVRDYVDGRGEKGGFQEKLKVYDRGGEPCLACGGILIKDVIAGRGTVFCPNCQRAYKQEETAVQSDTKNCAPVIGLTGGIASGKSMISDCLRKLGAVIIDADQIARGVVQKSTSAWQDIIDNFGPDILEETGEINRKALGDIIFQSTVAREKLNAIVHPRITVIVQDEINRMRKNLGIPLIVVDAPLLIEAGLHGMVDEVWVVAAPEEIQLARLMRRDGLSREEASRRIKSQMTLTDKLAFASRVIENSGDPKDTYEKVASLWQEVTGHKISPLNI